MQERAEICTFRQAKNGTIGQFMASGRPPPDLGLDVTAIREIADRLKIAVRTAGGNAHVAEISGVPLRTLNSYMAGAADPKLTKLDRIATACGTTVDALMGRKLPVTRQSDDLITNAFNFKPEEIEAALAYRAAQERGEIQIPPGFVPVPYLEVRASAGPGRASLPAETVALSHFLFSDRWLHSLDVSPQHAELLQAQGDSMYPTIHDGDLMLIDRGYGEVVHGKIYVLVVAGLVVVKRINYLAGGGMMLLSDNDRYPSETIRRDAVGDLSFQGRVVWYGRAI